MPEEEMTPLEKAVGELHNWNHDLDIERALTTISDASANLELRGSLQDASIFARLLDIYTTTYSTRQPPRTLLRCIGNLVSDNGVNRSNLISSSCVQKLKALLLNYVPSQQETDLEDFALKIFFNLCNDSPEIQKQAFELDIHGAIIDYLAKRTWIVADEMLLSLSASLLASLLDHKKSTRPAEDYTVNGVRKILTLPFLEHLDPDALLDLLNIVSVYLQDDAFIFQTVKTEQIHLVLNLLGLTEDAMRRECGEGAEADMEEEKQYRQYLNAFSQSLADLSSLPQFNDSYTVDNDFIKDLCRICIPLDSRQRQASLIPGCACLMLGNLAITDDVSIALASGMISINELLLQLGKSNESVFLNAAAGLLRHLAIPQKNRELFFGKPEHLEHVFHLYTDTTLEQIQLAGLQLTRQILMGMPERTLRVIFPQDPSPPPNLDTFLTLFAQTTSTATKLEISRLITSILRTLQSPSVARPLDESLRKLTCTPDILSPLFFSIKQSPSPGVINVQAEAWLAFNLFARLPGGSGVLATEASKDEEVFLLLSRRITKKEEGVVAVRGQENGTTEQNEDTRPEWVREKERDNAILLIHDLLKAEDVNEDIKAGLESLLKETEIRVHSVDGLD